ncbi:phage tail protein [Eggerthella sinensis]|uniref:Phage tail protein n=1 Tax=Eggerthella sinensis TaxID=242230 RepID=A0A3N0IY83_9ACTN|nr:phage tail protein [Eggerthella sinensis]RNM41927.1 phage tail protein [Eggerthella sinensis]
MGRAAPCAIGRFARTRGAAKGERLRACEGAAVNSIIYAGHDFSEICSAQVVGRSLNEMAVEAMRVAGRPGAVPASVWMPPEDIMVCLLMDPGFDPGVAGLASMRHRLRAWLVQPHGGTLVLPDEPELTYHDVLLVSAGNWTQLFEDGECEVTFTAFDPVAYGAERVVRAPGFEVGGTWCTDPAFHAVVEAGSGLQIANRATGEAVRLERAFAGGEFVVIDCADGSVRVDGLDARDAVALGSDFFALCPGYNELAFTGCSSAETRFVERWL